MSPNHRSPGSPPPQKSPKERLARDRKQARTRREGGSGSCRCRKCNRCGCGSLSLPHWSRVHPLHFRLLRRVGGRKEARKRTLPDGRQEVFWPNRGPTRCVAELYAQLAPVDYAARLGCQLRGPAGRRSEAARRKWHASDLGAAHRAAGRSCAALKVAPSDRF